MNVRQTRTLLHLASASLFAASAGVAYWGFTPIQQGDSTQASRNRPTQQAAGEKAASEDAPNIASHWNLKLRGPIQDPPKPKPKPLVIKPLSKQPAGVPVAQPKLDITLVGTILESGHGVGIFADADGKYDRKSVGEVLSLEPKGIRVEKIDANGATISLRGRKTTLQIKNKPKTQKNKSDRKRKQRF